MLALRTRFAHAVHVTAQHPKSPLLRRLLPGATALRNYPRAAVRPDAVAGLTVFAYLVPQVLAYSGLVGVPPAAGLATAFVALLAYALLGSSRLLSAGPESTTALMAGVAVAPYVSQFGAVQAIGALTLLVAAWMLLGRVLHLGVVARLLSRPILLGYMAGTGALMIGSQLGRLGRTSSSGETLYDQLATFAGTLDTVHAPTLGLGVAVLVALFVLPLVLPRIPAALVTIVVVTALSAVFALGDGGIVVLGAADAGGLVWSPPHWNQGLFGALLLPALGIAIVAYSDDMLTARGFAARGERVDADAELLALSGANAMAALVGGYPASASASRTAIAAAAGAHTRAYTFTVAGGVFAVMWFAGPLFADLPVAALAAVVVWAASRMIDIPAWRDLARFRGSEFALALATAIGAAVFGLLAGIGIAVALGTMDLLVRLARPHEAVQGFAPGHAGMHDIEDHPGAVTVPGLLIYRYDAPLFFGNVDDFRDEFATAMATHQPRWVILNVEAMMHVDFTACGVLRALIDDLQDAGIAFGLARLKHDLRVQLLAGGVMDVIAEEMVFDTLPSVVNAYGVAHPEVALPRIPPPGRPFESE